MLDRTQEFVFVGFWKRVLATLIDAAIGMAFLPLLIPMMTWDMSHRTILPELLWSIVWIFVWLWLVVHLGGTPGKLIIGVRIVDITGKFLPWGRAVRRIIFPTLITTINSQLQTWKTYSTYPDSAPHSSFLDMGLLFNEYGKPFSIIAMVFGIAVYADIGAILFNRKKRAIHDFIAGSYVVSKGSYTALTDEAKNSPLISE